MNQSLQLEAVTKELKSSNLSQDLILDTIDSFGYTLASNIAKEGTAVMPKLVEIAADIKGKFDVLIRSNVVLAKRLTENKLQEREDRGELIDTLKDLKSSPPPLPNQPPPLPKTPGGIFGKLAGLFSIGGPFAGGLLKGLGTMFPALGKIMSSKGFSSITKAFGTIGSIIAKIIPAGLMNTLSKIPKIFSIFGKFAKLAGPIGIAITVVTGLIGTIMGAIKGYKEDGVMGAIREGLIGLFNSVFASTVQVLADIGGWILNLFGLEKLGALLGPTVKQVLDQVMDNFRSLFNIFDAIISLDADKLTDELGKYFTNSWENIVKPLGNLLLTGIMEIFPLIIKGLKFLWFDLPIFIGKLGYKIIEYLVTEGPGLIKKIGVFIFDVIKNLFTEVFPNLFKTIFNDLTELFSGAGDSIAGIFGDIGGILDKFNKTILRAILPDPNAKRSWYNPLNLIKEAIPDSVYTYAFGAPAQETPKNNSEVAGDFSEKQKDFVEKETAARDKSLEVAKSFGYKSQFEAAQAAGFKNGPEWRAAGMPDPRKMQESIMTVPNPTGAALNAAGNSANTTVVNVTNNNGGNVSSVRSSNVNNSVPTHMPIYTGSMAMGY